MRSAYTKDFDNTHVANAPDDNLNDYGANTFAWDREMTWPETAQDFRRPTYISDACSGSQNSETPVAPSTAMLLSSLRFAG